MQTFALITTCKGRLHHLKQTLPLMWAQQPDEVIVVDYGCPDGAGAWVEAHFPKTTVVRVNDDPLFHIARARNIGAAHARSSWLIFIDADVITQPGWLDWLRQNVRAQAFYRPGKVGDKRLSGSYGTFCVEKSAFDNIGGYDEVFRGWGAEDNDLYGRLLLSGLQESDYPPAYVDAIPHGDAERVAFYEIKNKKIQHKINRIYMDAKLELLTLLASNTIPLEGRRECMDQIRRHITGKSWNNFVPCMTEKIVLQNINIDGRGRLLDEVTLRLKRRYVWFGPMNLSVHVRESDRAG